MKPWKDVTLTDDYLFSQIMKDEDFCKLFLEMRNADGTQDKPGQTDAVLPLRH